MKFEFKQFDVITIRSGVRYVLLGENFINDTGWMRAISWNEMDHQNDSGFDIMKVERQTENINRISKLLNADRMVTVFDRLDRLDIKVGDIVQIKDNSYMQEFSENGLVRSYSLVVGESIVVRAMNCNFAVGRHSQTNDTIVDCNGKLYTIQKRFLKKDLT
jgi:hypothetical protein